MIEYLASAACIGGAIYALQARHLMRGVLGLAVFFLGIAMFFGILGAWFLAVGQAFLFIGGVVTLFVLAFNFADPPEQRKVSNVALFIAVAGIAVLSMYVPIGVLHDVVPLQQFAGEFFGKYGLALIAAILLLFSAIIGAQYLIAEERA